MRPPQFLLSLVAASFALAAPAFADPPAYVGTWASDLAQCKIPQDRQEAPLVFTAKGYDQYETHCRFASAKLEDEQWKIKANCTVEGNAAPYDFTLTVSGDTLTIADENGANDLLRCR